MPYHFKCCDEQFKIFTGIDAKENDLLARWGWEEDILFHVGNLPGGHVYLRTNQVINKKLFKKIRKLSDFESMMGIPANVIEECLQITKQYSSRGRKEKVAQIHITPWLNVKKMDGDNPGTVLFTDHSLVKTLRASTDKNVVEMLQETRIKRKMKEDDFRRERDAKYGCYRWNPWNRRDQMNTFALSLYGQRYIEMVNLKMNMLMNSNWSRRPTNSLTLTRFKIGGFLSAQFSIRRLSRVILRSC